MSGTTIVTLRSTDTGAPRLSGTAGDIIALFDACLINGYNSKTVLSMVRTNQTVTVYFATAHNLAGDGVTKVLISGADQVEYNGIFKISNIQASSFDITVTGSPLSPATGTTITSKVAPVGWSKAFTGTNLGVYRSLESTATKLYLRIDDTGTLSCRARGFETMSDVNNGSGLFPTDLQLSGGLFIQKSNSASTASRPWILVGDGFEFFFFSAAHGSYPTLFYSFHFGDPASEMTSDPYGCLIYGGNADDTGQAPAFYCGVAPQSITTSLAAQAGHYYARIYNQLGGSVGASKLGSSGLGGTTIGYGGILTYPAQHNNGLYIAPIVVSDTYVIRGQLKGLYQPLHRTPLGNWILVDVSLSPINRRLYSIGTSVGTQGNILTGEVHVDIDGPWR
jgi:hypothetical protein